MIAKPKKWGGWGVQRIELFSKALAAKLSWQLITTNSVWTCVAQAKYIWPIYLMDWFRQRHRVNNNASNIWNAIINAIQLIWEGIT